MPVALATAATDRSISAHRMTKVRPTAMIPATEMLVSTFHRLSKVRNEGLEKLKKMTSAASVRNGAMLRSWLLNQVDTLLDGGRTSVAGALISESPSPTPLRAAGPC